MTLKREIKNAYIENGHPVYIKTHSDAVYVDENETETLTERLDKVGSIKEYTTQLNNIANEKANKSDIVNDCNTSDSTKIAGADQLKYLKDYIDQQLQGTLSHPYEHEANSSGLNIINLGWNHCHTNVEAPESDGDYYVLVINPYRSSDNVNGTLLKQIWFPLWNENIYVRQCSITDGWKWTAFKQL